MPGVDKKLAAFVCFACCQIFFANPPAPLCDCALGVNNFDVSLIVHLLTSLASLPLGQDDSQG